MQEQQGQRPAEADADRSVVLVVDDDRDVRTTLVELLDAEAEFEVIACPNGQAATDVLDRRRVDAVITDLIMPGPSGLELIEWANARGLNPAWIILTGRAELSDAQAALRLGAFDLITKPLANVESLAVTLRNALRQRALERQRDQLLDEVRQRNDELERQVHQLNEVCQMLGEQARTINEDLERAELIQRALLPRVVPEFPDVSVNVVYRPSHKVGGDLYDVIRLSNRYLVTYVADAAGHGISAAVLAVLFRHRVPVIADIEQTPSEPAEALRAVNNALLAECSAPGLFVTAAYCLLDTHTGLLKIGSAGHPPLLLCRKNGRLERIEHTGPALGISEKVEFSQWEGQLAEGDRLFMYTDGLLESVSPAEPLELDALCHLLSDRHRCGQEVLNEALRRAEAHRQSFQEDDITALLVTTAAGQSSVDNGQLVRKLRRQRPAVEIQGVEILQGQGDGSAYFSIAGRADWTYSAAFHDACQAEMEAGRDVRLDLTDCEYLDSTFLGTILELVDRSSAAGVGLAIQGVRPELADKFAELGMNRVLDRFTADQKPPPPEMAPVQGTGGTGQQDFRRMLLAHEALADLNPQNRREFQGLLDGLRKELSEAEAER